MATELSFAQALNEARQIIVQQSNRIKADLDRIKTMQETLTTQTATIADQERALARRASEVEELTGQVRELDDKLEATRTAKDQAEAVCDRQGQRLTQLQESAVTMERQASEAADRIAEMTEELNAARGQVPTSEDNEALVALATLLSTKKAATPTQAAAAAPRIAA